jgi:NADPH:quinone reductase-like Zn-dependent oxidoreductase
MTDSTALSWDPVRPGERVYASLFPAGAGAAHEGLVDRGRLQAGETLLITAAGGVGTAAVQIAAAIGARPSWLLDAVGGQTRDQAIGAVRDGGRAIFIVLQGSARQARHWRRSRTCTRAARSCCESGSSGHAS